MEDGRILDSQISASSFWDSITSPRHGRLNSVLGGGSWSPQRPTARQYLQIDLSSKKTILKVATQGRHHNDQRVTKYSLKYGDSNTQWTDYTVSGSVKVSSDESMR